MLNIANYKIFATVPVVQSPTSISLSPDGQFLYVADGSSNNVSVIAIRTNRVTATTTPVGISPVNLAVSHDGTAVYVAGDGSANVSVRDTATNRVVRDLPAGQCPVAVAVTPGATASPEPLTWAPGTGPFDIAATPTAIYVASQAKGTPLMPDERPLSTRTRREPSFQ